jgi:hypothetical protein
MSGHNGTIERAIPKAFAAIWLAALPAPTTMVRPLGRAGKWARMAASGSAASTAASNRLVSKGRGSSIIQDHLAIWKS